MDTDEEAIVALSRKIYEHTRKALQKEPPETAMIVLTLTTQMLISSAAKAWDTDLDDLMAQFCHNIKDVTERFG